MHLFDLAFVLFRFFDKEEKQNYKRLEVKNQEERKMTETIEEEKIESDESEIEKNLIKFGECKICKRHEKLFQELCFWCFKEKNDKLILGLNKILREAGRSSIIDKSELENLRNEFLGE